MTADSWFRSSVSYWPWLWEAETKLWLSLAAFCCNMFFFSQKIQLPFPCWSVSSWWRKFYFLYLSIHPSFCSPYLHPHREARPCSVLKRNPDMPDFTWQPREQREPLKGEVARTMCCHWEEKRGVRDERREGVAEYKQKGDLSLLGWLAASGSNCTTHLVAVFSTPGPDWQDV